MVIDWTLWLEKPPVVKDCDTCHHFIQGEFPPVCKGCIGISNNTPTQTLINWREKTVLALDEEPCVFDCLIEVSDPVNHPHHYTQGSIEVIDFIEDQKMGYHQGNITQYVSRYRFKNGIEDLKKAQWYLERLIGLVEAGAPDSD